MYRVVHILVQQLGAHFPELEKQQELIRRVIMEEEQSFLRTLSSGIQRFEQFIVAHPDMQVIDGHFAFELFDTYGFPIDLTCLMASERNFTVDMTVFTRDMTEQKQRSRSDANTETEDWVIIRESSQKTEFVGYDVLKTEIRILRYRKFIVKEKTAYQLVFDKTPFYAESGGQMGDTGCLVNGSEKIIIRHTQKENNLVIHICDRLPENPSNTFIAEVDTHKRSMTQCNHSATHLLHYALRKVLGNQVEQKGSMVDAQRLRFDFSHFSKMEKQEIRTVEHIVNNMIRENIPLKELRKIPLSEAREMGAIALFGEKYDNEVRVIQFGQSIEFCGGTHVRSTGVIGLFRITSESAIASGIRRIEAVTNENADQFVYSQSDALYELKAFFHHTPDVLAAVKKLSEENKILQKKVETLRNEKITLLQTSLLQSACIEMGIHFIVYTGNAEIDVIRQTIPFLKDKLSDKKWALIAGLTDGGKPSLMLFLSDPLADSGKNAAQIIRQVAVHIQGGGGGQAFLATAGGKNCEGIAKALIEIKTLILGN
jgi:alanyl-tRNA synthetase